MSLDSASLVLALERYCSSLLLASCRCSLCHRLSLWRAFFHGCTRARSFAWLPLRALTTLSLQLSRRRHGLRCRSCPPPSKMFYSLAWTCLSSNIDACLGSFWSHLPQNRLQRLRRCEPLRQSGTICLKNGLVSLSATCCRPGCQLGLIAVLLLALWLEPLDPCMFPPPNFGWKWPPKKVVTYWHVVMRLCRVARRTMLWLVRICRPGLGATTTISDFRPPTTKAFCSCSPCLLAMSGSTTCAGKPWEWLSSRRFCRRKNGPPGGQSFCCMPSTQWMTLCLRSGSQKRLMEEPFHRRSRNKSPVGHSCCAQCLRDLSPSDTTSTRLIGCSVATSKSHAAEQLAGTRWYESRFSTDAVCHLHPSFLSPCVSPLSIVRYLPLLRQPRGAVRRAAADQLAISGMSLMPLHIQRVPVASAVSHLCPSPVLLLPHMICTPSATELFLACLKPVARFCPAAGSMVRLPRECVSLVLLLLGVTGARASQVPRRWSFPAGTLSQRTMCKLCAECTLQLRAALSFRGRFAPWRRQLLPASWHRRHTCDSAAHCSLSSGWSFGLFGVMVCAWRILSLGNWPPATCTCPVLAPTNSPSWTSLPS